MHKPNNNFTKIEEINKTISKLLPNNHFEVDLTVLDHVEKEKTILLDETKLKSEEFFKKLLEKSIKLCNYLCLFLIKLNIFFIFSFKSK